MSSYTIKIENFEGPFDLLFHLIEKNKIDIYDIPIATITEQYLDYLQTMQEMDLEITSEFLVMAATLLHIKSRMLLPNLKENDDQELQIDPREELVTRLLEYKKYKEFAQQLKEREEYYRMIYYKYPDIIDKNTSDQLIGLSIEDLVNAFKKVVERNVSEEIDSKNTFSKIIKREKISVAKKIREIIKLLRNKEIIKFDELFNYSSKMDKIATFLAILELIKLRKVIIEQASNFGEIVIYKNKRHA